MTVTAPSGLVTAFAYDGDGVRVGKVEQRGAFITTTLYVGGVEVAISSALRITRTYYAAGASGWRCGW